MLIVFMDLAMPYGIDIPRVISFVGWGRNPTVNLQRMELHSQAFNREK